MTQIIQPSELEHLSECELRALHARIVEDLIRSGLTLEESPHVSITLGNIRRAIHRRRLAAPRR